MAEKFKISNLDLYYGDFHALKKYQYVDRIERDYSIYRTERLRKIHLFEEFKQNERSGRGM